MFPSRIASVLGEGTFENTYSLEFDGSNDYVAFSAETFTGQFTVAFWINGDLATNYTNIVTNDSGANNVRVWSTNGVIRAKVNNENAATITGISDDTWTHCVFTRDGADLVVGYKDGVQTGATTTTAGDYVLTRIGHSSSSFPGKIDEVAIWNTALSAGQVKELYNGGESFNAKNILSSNLKGYWRMGDGVLDDRITTGVVADQVNATLGSDLASSLDWNNNDSSPYETLTTSGNVVSEAANTTGWGIAITDTFSLTAGIVYQVNFNFTLNSGASPNYIRVAGNDSVDAAVQWQLANPSNGLQTHYFIAAASLSSFRFGVRENDATNWSLSALSIKPVNGNAGVLVNFDGTDFKKDTH